MEDQEKTETETVEVTEEVVEAVADKAAKKVAVDTAKIAQDAAEAAVAKFVQTTEKTIDKGVNGGTKVAGAGENEVSKEVMFMRAAVALVRGNRDGLKAYNEKAMELREKAGYGNSDVDADGGYIIALPEFEAEIESLSNVYGIAFSEADVRTINSNSVKTNKRGSNVSMYETSEGAQKTGTKLTISQVTAELRKFAAIAVATDEMVEDAAIDFWAETSQGFAEERARIADELVFTDTNATYPGILRAAGTKVISVGASITSIDWDDLMDAEAAVPTKAFRNGKHYMHRTVWNVLRQKKASGSGEYMALPINLTGNMQTPWGTPVVLVDVLPSTTSYGDANEPYTVFGDLKRIKLYVKRGLVLDQLKEATVHDANGNAINLAEKDMTALRAVTRMVALTTKFPEAFAVIGTGTVS